MDTNRNEWNVQQIEQAHAEGKISDTEKAELLKIAEHRAKNGNIPPSGDNADGGNTGRTEDKAPAPVLTLAEKFAKLGLDEQFESLAQCGEADGREIASQFANAARFEIDRIMERAKLFAGDDEVIREYLSGYGKVRGKVRASEMRAVMDACTKDYDRLFKARVDGKDYHETVKLAREIRGTGQNTGNRSKRVSIGDKTAKKLETNVIPLANASQAAVIADTALDTLVRKSQEKAPDSGAWEVALLEQAEGIANRLKTSRQPIFQNAGMEMVDVVGKVLDPIRAESAKQAAAKSPRKPEVPQVEVPKPAEDVSGKTGTHG